MSLDSQYIHAINNPQLHTRSWRIRKAKVIVPVALFFFGVYAWLVKVLGQFSIIYFRGLGLRIGVRVWVRVRVGVRVSVVLWSQ